MTEVVEEVSMLTDHLLEVATLKSVAEIRRLRAVNAELLAALEGTFFALSLAVENTAGSDVRVAWENASAAIAKAAP